MDPQEHTLFRHLGYVLGVVAFLYAFEWLRKREYTPRAEAIFVFVLGFILTEFAWVIWGSPESVSHGTNWLIGSAGGAVFAAVSFLTRPERRVR